MRYYDITCGPLHYTSLGANGRINPGALNVEIDIVIEGGDKPDSGSTVRVWGIGLPDISQARNLHNKPISVKGGMSAGLPLANPAEAGPLGAGIIYKAFGNWIGTDQTLDLIMSPSSAPATESQSPNPEPITKNIILNGKKGQQIRDPLKQALQTAFPGMKIDMNIADKYELPSDQIGFHGALYPFAQQVRRYSQMLAGKNSQGIGIHIFNNTVHVADGSSPQQSIDINYQDLIGQPTWLDANLISIKVVMRGDLKINTFVTLPKTLVTNTANGGYGADGGGGSPSTTLTFQGVFQIVKLRHVGNFRQADAASWCTIIEGTFQSGNAGDSGSAGGASNSPGGIGSDAGAVGSAGGSSGGGIGSDAVVGASNAPGGIASLTPSIPGTGR
jgi:hypothetical protein